MKPIPFATPEEFRTWLEKHHATEKEIFLRFYKKASGKGGLTYGGALDEALCYGWIDGLARGIDAISYSQRFTPRKAASNWSLINVGHIARLKKAGKMHPAGLAAFAQRKKEKTGVYSFEAKVAPEFSAAQAKTFRANKKAWAFFAAQPPGYRHLSTWHVVTAKQEATRTRRLEKLIAASAAEQRLG